MTAKNSAKNSAARRDAQGRLRDGNPGNSGGKKGRSGRPPNEFRVFLAAARRNPKVQAALLKALRDPESRGFTAALRVLTDYDDEKPAQRLQVDLNKIDQMTDDELAAIVQAGTR